MSKIWSAGAVAAVLFGSASAWAAQSEVCIPEAGLPTMDGMVAADPGWNGSARIDLDLEGILPQTYARLVRTSTHLYLGLSVYTPALAPGESDRVVLGLFTSDEEAAWRIHIQPFTDSVPGGAASAAWVRYWRNSATWLGNVSSLDPSDSTAPAPWLQPQEIRTYYHGNGFWEMELKIPIQLDKAKEDERTAVYFPPIGQHVKLYLNVLKTSGTGFVCQYPWRRSSPIDGTLTGGTPVPTTWGIAWFNPKPGCQVVLTCSRIGLVAPPCPTANTLVPLTPAEPFGDCSGLPDNHLFPLTGPANTFFAKPFNKTAAIVQLRARFDVSDFGVPGPGDWWTVARDPGWPAPLANPTPGAGVGSGTDATLCLDWPLSYKESCRLDSTLKSIRVQLLNSDGNPDPSLAGGVPMVRCFPTVPLSTFEADARIGTRGLPPPAAGPHAFLLLVGKDVLPRPSTPPPPPAVLALAARRGTTPDAMEADDVAELSRRSFPPAVAETFHWTCRAFRRTGQALVFDDQPRRASFADTRAAGAFGYLAGHAGPVERYAAEFSGPGLRRAAEGLFELEVPPGAQGLVHTRLEAESFHRWALRFRIGAALPHGDLADAVDAGWSELASLEYRINSLFSLEARLGVSTFEGDAGGPDVYAVQHALNARATFLDGPFRPFVNAGPGFYASNPGDDDVGFNAGAGLGWRIDDRFTLEAAWDYHHVFADGDDAAFSTLQIGVGLKF